MRGLGHIYNGYNLSHAEGNRVKNASTNRPLFADGLHKETSP